MTAIVDGMSSSVCAVESTGAPGGKKMEGAELVGCGESSHAGS